MLRLLGKWTCLLRLPAVVYPQVERGATLVLVSDSSDAAVPTAVGQNARLPGGAKWDWKTNAQGRLRIASAAPRNRYGHGPGGGCEPMVRDNRSQRRAGTPGPDVQPRLSRRRVCTNTEMDQHTRACPNRDTLTETWKPVKTTHRNRTTFAVSGESRFGRRP